MKNKTNEKEQWKVSLGPRVENAEPQRAAGRTVKCRGRWGKRIGQSAARPTEPSSDEQPRGPRSQVKTRKGGKQVPKNTRPCACAAAARWSRPNVRWWRSQPSAVRPDTGAFSGHEKGRGTDAPHDLGSLGSTHLATENKPVTKGHVFPDSIYHEKSTRGKSVERRVEEGLSGAGRPGGKGVSQLKGTRFIFEVVKMS